MVSKVTRTRTIRAKAVSTKPKQTVKQRKVTKTSTRRVEKFTMPQKINHVDVRKFTNYLNAQKPIVQKYIDQIQKKLPVFDDAKKKASAKVAKVTTLVKKNLTPPQRKRAIV
jgi:predicted glycoside hydrolase/deacetylase ChbG (UPF0249 family)